MKIFVDMDGTIAKFYEKPNYLEKMYEKEFFRNLKPYALAKTINQLAEQGYDVYILSACVNTTYCKQEKILWCKEFLPNVKAENIILLGIGENKAKRVAELVKDNEYAILIDDYGYNLEQWTIKPNYVAIKRINGINCKKGKKYEYTVKFGNDLYTILDKYEENEKKFIKE